MYSLDEVGVTRDTMRNDTKVQNVKGADNKFI